MDFYAATVFIIPAEDTGLDLSAPGSACFHVTWLKTVRPSKQPFMRQEQLPVRAGPLLEWEWLCAGFGGSGKRGPHCSIMGHRCRRMEHRFEGRKTANRHIPGLRSQSPSRGQRTGQGNAAMSHGYSDVTGSEPQGCLTGRALPNISLPSTKPLRP